MADSHKSEILSFIHGYDGLENQLLFRVMVSDDLYLAIPVSTFNANTTIKVEHEKCEDCVIIA